ncbi:DNA ligase LigA-related protein [Bradyrhizobium ottawaense]|uniref:Uncharacterized protein n=1 Tax=Bradyrhizobium ottawaense TaxID=931866 RepID=A0ABY0QHK2_9BRAD|nr:hypothetical protein [Bradyrhizobium ottawaense]SDK38488.1 hypothetical protein SAMN05444163_7986 [Bradyrhizobium ottawaense]SDK46509.1 hypothetical protein SAMN05444163_8179 [Bradyrhizobium ottawaense]
MTETLDLFAYTKVSGGTSLADLDWHARRIVVASYLYYRHDLSMMPDHEFDNICQVVADGWRGLSPLRQFMLESPGAIRASGFHVKVTWMAEAGAFAWMRENRQRENVDRGPVSQWNFDKTHQVHWAGLAAP